MDIDTDKTKSGFSITKDTAISLAVLIPVVAMFVGAMMWMSTVHAKVDASKQEVMMIREKVIQLEKEQRDQLNRYIQIEIKLGI